MQLTFKVPLLMPTLSLRPDVTLPLPLRPAGQIPPPGPPLTIAGVDPALPCDALPGSAAKIAIMRLRAERGLPLCLPRDASLPPRVGYIPTFKARLDSDATAAAAVVEEGAGGELIILERKTSRPDSRRKPLTDLQHRRLSGRAA
jgi:hypothetical protein